MDGEEQLTGGNSSQGVVRVGKTIRKPWSDSSPHVAAYMAAVRAAGVDVPEHFGQDEEGRQVLEFVPGQLAMSAEPTSADDLVRVGVLVRSIHDASEGYRPALDAVWDSAIAAPGADLVCHSDLAPWNLIIGDRWTFIDWDASAPSTRLWDLAYAAQAFTLSDPTEDPERAALNLAAFIDGYGADTQTRAELPLAMQQRATAMYKLLESSNLSGAEPWASMFTSGHGGHWRAVRDYVGRNREVWARAVSWT